jgi:hypothetical protein
MMDPVATALSGGDRDTRLSGLGDLVARDEGRLSSSPLTDEVNNHVHTCYSFSPYTPSHAAWMARMAGLRAVGSVDHDSIGAAEEMIEACKLLRIGSTVGYELRVNFTGTAFGERRLNNPDSIGIGYIATHGVPRPRIPAVREFLAPLQRARNKRNRRQVSALNDELRSLSAPEITFAEVEASSMSHEGGSITERHILYVAARRLMEWLGTGKALRGWIEEHVTGPLPARLASYLDDPDNPHYVYDLLGSLKSTFLPRFFIQPGPDECIPVAEAVAFANGIGAIPAYAYLGDVAESPTGDKKAETFEDAYLDELVRELPRLGFRAVTYMPPRNTREQLRRVQGLCTEHALMEISGVDINSSRQAFTCPEIMEPEFHHLIDTTWALIAHEKLTSIDATFSLFAPDNPLAGLALPDRIARYARAGRAMDPARPEDIRDNAGL